MLGDIAPIADGLEAGPVRNRDSDSLLIADTLQSQKAGLCRGQFDHAVCGDGIPFGIGGCPQ